MRAVRRLAAYGITALALILPVELVSVMPAGAATAFSKLTLQNGWTAVSGTGTPSASASGGVVTISGAIHTSGTNPVAFTLPTNDRPAAAVYVPVDLADGYTARLDIATSGAVAVEVDGGSSMWYLTASFVSIQASFALNATGYTALSLANGWTNGPYGTANAAAKVTNGIVRLMGAVYNGSAAQITTLPAGFTPPADVFVPVDLCNSTNGELEVQPSGAVTVLAEGNDFANANCFTSLDGVTFATSTSGFADLTLESGWTDGPSGTSMAAAEDINGIVHLQGAFETGGSNRVPTTLPPADSPTVEVYVKVDVCNGQSAQLGITNSGAVVMNAEGQNFPPTNCVISLEGVTFPATAFTKLALKNGWSAVHGSLTPGVAVISSPQGKVVTFQGAITTAGTNSVAFTLPTSFRPGWTVYLPIDMCNATNGRLIIDSTGTASIQAETSFTNCLTSLDGVSFILKTTNGYEAGLSLQNGWTGTQTQYNTFSPSESLINGIVYLQGAVSGGSSNVIGTVAFHPAAPVYIPADLCGATNGRIDISTSGTVSVDGDLTNAQCFTSLDGVSYGTADAPAPLTLINGWTGGAFGTASPAVDNYEGVVRLLGAMSTTGTNPVAFVLPVGDRPAQTVHVKADLCNGTNGDLVITPNGRVTVEAENTFSDAQCFTSLDGVQFAS